MIDPSAKSWIHKYFELVEKGKISLHIERDFKMKKLNFMHQIFSKTGILYGFSLDFIFAKSFIDSKWTAEEKNEISFV